MVLSSRFDRIAAWAASGCVDDGIEQVLRSGFRAYFKAGGAVSLERCLGLPGRDAAKAYRLAERDYHLRRAAQLMAGPDGLPSSTDFGGKVLRFMSSVWPRWKHLAVPPAGCSEAHAALFAAMRLGTGNLPRSARQIGRRVTDPLLMGGSPGAIWAAERLAVFERDAAREWLDNEAFRLEFETFERFRAWWRADAEGLVRYGCAADMFSGGDVQRGDPDSGNTLTGDSHESAEPRCPARHRSP